MQLVLQDGSYIITTEGVDCSIPLRATSDNPKAWYVDNPVFEAVRTDNWIGSVAEGGSVNFRNIHFNPHGHGTHTECLGHITEEVYSVNGVIKNGLMRAALVSVEPKEVKTESGEIDYVVHLEQIEPMLETTDFEALIIRTLPNDEAKKSANYSASNPPYLHVDLIPLLNQLNVKHLLVDLPSVDREIDGGVLAFHHAFWNVPSQPRFDRTITELIYVPSTLVDGIYLLNLETAPFENDATPSRPVLYPLHPVVEG